MTTAANEMANLDAGTVLRNKVSGRLADLQFWHHGKHSHRAMVLLRQERRTVQLTAEQLAADYVVEEA